MFVLRLFCFSFFVFFSVTFAFKSPSSAGKKTTTEAAPTVKEQKVEPFTLETDNDLNLKQSIEKPGGLFNDNVVGMYPSYYYQKEDEKEKQRHIREALEQSDLIEIEPLAEVLPSYILTEIENAKAQKVKTQQAREAKFAIPGDIKWAEKSKDIFVLKTDVGDIFIELDPKSAPNTVAEIKKLMIDGFYSNMLFFRVVSKYLVQTGDPSNTGFGGEMLKAKDEFSKEKMTRGVVAVANKGYANSQSSQFFILLNDSSWLNSKYTIIGHVIEGIEVLDKIKPGSTKTNGLVEKPSRIYAIDWYYNEVQKRIKQQKNAAIIKSTQAGETTGNNPPAAATTAQPANSGANNNADDANNNTNPTPQ